MKNAEEKVLKTNTELKKVSSLFTKEQLISSKKYSDRKDALSVLLADGKTYSFEETDRILENFMKGKVG